MAKQKNKRSRRASAPAQRVAPASPQSAIPNPQSAPQPPLAELGSLGELEAVHVEEVVVPVIFGGRASKMTGRRLFPAESGSVALWLERAHPNVLPGEGKDDGPRFDLLEPDYKGPYGTGYQARRLFCMRNARALALWSAFPHFRQQAEQEGVKPQSQEDIFAFVEGRKLPDELLESLYQPLMRDNVRAVLGFT